MTIDIAACCLYPSSQSRISRSDGRHRQLRFVEAALRLAAEGGYDGIHMRLIAERAGSATSTLYQSFSSKDHLLVAALHRWLELFAHAAEPELVEIAEPYERLAHITRRMQVELFASPTMAYAFARAYLVAGGSAAQEVERVRDRMASMFAGALGLGRATRMDVEVGHVITDVWASNVIAVSRNRGTVTDVIRSLDLTITVLTRSHLRLTTTATATADFLSARL